MIYPAKIRRLHAIILGFLFTFAVSCSREPVQEPIIRIGVIIPLSGELKQNGQVALEGARLAVHQINDAGGIDLDGRAYRIALVPEDSRNIAEVAVNAARKLINQDNVAALVGPYNSAAAVPVAMVAEHARIPMISPTATDPEVTAGKQYAFRVVCLDDFQGSVLVRFAREELDSRTAAVLYDVASLHNRGIARIFKKGFEEAGGRIVAFETYTTGEQDFRPQMRRIRKTKPDILFLPNYPDDVSRQVRLARQFGVDATLLGSDAWTDLVLADVDDASDFEGAYQSNPWHPDMKDERTQRFDRAFQKVYHVLPSSDAALTYDALGMILEAIRVRKSLDGEQIRNALASLEDYPGVAGPISYRGTGDPVKGVVMLRIKDGRVTFYKQVNP